MFNKKEKVNQAGDKYIYVNPSSSNDVTIGLINSWAKQGYKVVANSVGMIIMERVER